MIALGMMLLIGLSQLCIGMTVVEARKGHYPGRAWTVWYVASILVSGVIGALLSVLL